MTPVPRGRAARSLGWRWEHALTHRIKAIEGWDADRIGAASKSLPDVLAFSRVDQPEAYVFECKATSRDRSINVPRGQLVNLLRWVHGPLRAYGIHAHAIVACRWTWRPGRAVEKFVAIPRNCFISDDGLAVNSAGYTGGVTYGLSRKDPEVYSWLQLDYRIRRWRREGGP